MSDHDDRIKALEAKIEAMEGYIAKSLAVVMDDLEDVRDGMYNMMEVLGYEASEDEEQTPVN